MFMKSDYIMDQVQLLGRFIGLVLFQKGESITEYIQEDNFLCEGALVQSMLRRMIHEGKINEAENHLYDELERNQSEENLKLGLWFYHELNQLDDKTLEAADFSRDEILDGLKDLDALCQKLL